MTDGKINYDSVLSLEDLTIGYDDKIIMQNINFSVKRGEIISILGQSGCGKSTLLKNIIGIYSPLKGSIRIFGRDLTKCGENRRRILLRKMGITYQSGALLGSLSIAENVALPLEEHTSKSPQEIKEISKSTARSTAVSLFIRFIINIPSFPILILLWLQNVRNTGNQLV